MCMNTFTYTCTGIEKKKSHRLLTLSFCLFVLSFWVKVSCPRPTYELLCTEEWSWIPDPPSQVLGLQVWATMPSSLPRQLDLRDEDIKTQWATPRSGAWVLSGSSLLMWKIQKNQILRWQLKQLSFTPNRTVWHLNRMWGACKTPRPTPSWKELY